VASTFENGPLLSRAISSGELQNPVFAVSGSPRAACHILTCGLPLQIALQRDTVDIGGTGQLSIGKLPDGVSNSSFTWVPVRLYSQNDGGLAPPGFAPNEASLRF
jgi:hypothetical protein